MAEVNIATPWTISVARTIAAVPSDEMLSVCASLHGQPEREETCCSHPRVMHCRDGSTHQCCAQDLRSRGSSEILTIVKAEHQRDKTRNHCNEDRRSDHEQRVCNGTRLGARIAAMPM